MENADVSRVLTQTADASIRHLDDPFGMVGKAQEQIAEAAAVERARFRPRTNALQGDEHHDAIGEALAVLAGIVGRTAGPHGSPALVQDQTGAHFATKDGYTVLRHVVFLQDTARMVSDLVRSLARTIVRRVGDGSTTSILMAASLFDSFRSPVFQKYPPGALQAAMAGCAALVSDYVIESSKKDLDSRDLVAVATIAANNDPKAGALVAACYEKYGEDVNIYVGSSRTDKTTIEAVPGFRILRGMADDCFANESGTDSAKPTLCRMGPSRIFIWGGAMTDRDFALCAAPVLNQASQRSEGFVIVANGFDARVIEISRQARQKGANLLLIDHAMGTRRSAARLGDLAAVTDADYLDPDTAPRLSSFDDRSEEGEAIRERLYQSTGVVESLTSSITETAFIITGRWPEAEKRAAEIEASIEFHGKNNHSEALEDEMDELRARLRALRGTEVELLAGGGTEQEKESLRYLLDDAVLACSAALRSGVVEGLGMTALRLFAGDDRPTFEIGLADIIRKNSRVSPTDALDLASHTVSATEEAYRDVLGAVFSNARMDPGPIIMNCLNTGRTFDLVSRDYVSPGDANINPAATDAEVIRGAMGIVSILATSDQTLLLRVAVGGGQD